MNKECILAGTFEIGEKVRKEQLLAIRSAQQPLADIILLVNDLGIAQKLLAYEKGRTGVNTLYAERLACARTGCQISQLPKNDVEIDAIRDDAAILEMLHVLRAYTSSHDHKEVQKICNEVIVPEQIRKRVTLYGLVQKDVRVYCERNLRNAVSNTLRSRYQYRQNSLLPLIHFAQKQRQGLALLLEELQSQQRMPTCRAIMLELYIELSMLGYKKLQIVQEPIHQLAFENASELYQNLRHVFSDDRRFQLQIEHRTLPLVVK